MSLKRWQHRNEQSKMSRYISFGKDELFLFPVTNLDTYEEVLAYAQSEIARAHAEQNYELYNHAIKRVESVKRMLKRIHANERVVIKKSKNILH